jgi:hypothetical protein
MIDIKQACLAMKGFSLREKCRRIAFNAEELFPHVCIDIMEQVYGEYVSRHDLQYRVHDDGHVGGAGQG